MEPATHGGRHELHGPSLANQLQEAGGLVAAGQVFQHVPVDAVQESEAAYRQQSDNELLRANLEDRKADTVSSGGDGSVTIDVSLLHKHNNAHLRRQLLDDALETQDQDNEALLVKYRQRLDRAGVELSKVEVRFQNLNVSADVSIGSRGMPTVANAFINTPKEFLTNIGLLRDDKHHLSILNNASGVLKPGRFTLLLGPPGGGKTTLLKALAGAVRDGTNGINMSGRVTYNDEGFESFQVARTCAYISQVDMHLAELTVRETFDFAARCLGVGHKADYAAQLRQREAEAGISPDPQVDAMIQAEAVPGKRHTISTDLMLRILGMEVCADTIVGNQLMRGISGGQKKRVTTGEMLVGPAKTLFMDEISTGLDASTTLLIVRCIRNYVHLMKGTVLMALLQPPPEVFELFDDVMLLSEGQVVYHGAREQVVPFFASLGFAIPERKGVADFLQEVTSSKDQAQYWSKEDEPYKFVSMQQFHRAYLESPEGAAMTQALAAPHEPPTPGLDPLVRSKYALTGWQSFKACMRRELILVQRNAFLYTFKTWQVFFVAIVTGTLFLYTQWDTYNEHTGSIYLGLIFYSIVHVMFNGYSEMSLMVNSLPVFYKQRAAQFFPAWSFALPTSLVRLPYSIVEGVLWSCVAYWLTGMAPDAGRFFIYLGYMILTHNMAIGLFRLMGALGRDYNRTNVFGSFMMVLTILLGGFVLKKSSIHPWYIWVYWISPLMYVQQALTLNEFSHERWQTPLTVNGVTKPTAQWVLESMDIQTAEYWRWMPALVLLGFALLFNYLTFVALTHLPPPKGDSALFSEEYLSNREYNRTGTTPETLVTNTGRATALKRIVSLGNLTSKDCSSKGSAGGDRHVNGTANGQGMHIVSAESASPAGSSTPTNGNHAAFSGADAVMHMATNGHTADASSTKDVELGLVPGAGGKAVAFDKSVAVPAGGSQRGMTLPFEPMALAFKDVCYYVDLPKGAEPPSADEDGRKTGAPKVVVEHGRQQIQLLHNITGSFRPGVLCALMGVSGAGKTTLMDVLAGRKTVGRVTGDIWVDGHPKVQETFARVMGYVEQSDIHSARTTVREALVLSAVLRLQHTRERRLIESFVDDVLELTELGPQRDALVGQPGLFGLSLEQRKRLTISVELVANPSLVFMDEPTSGLDARAAAIVMRAVRNTVNTGRTVVCTIHQPSIDIFESFDELLLLKRGGRVMYQGPLGDRSCHLVDYFQSIPGCGTLPEGLNPATWMLEVSTVSAETALGRDFGDIYEASDMAKANNALVEELSKPKPGSQPLHFDEKYAASMWEQFKMLSYRAFVSYWRNPEYNAVRFAFCIMLGFFLGTIYLFLGNRRESTTDILNVMAALFICTTFLGTSNSSGVMPIVGNERPVFYRERAAGMYDPLPYVVAQVLVELPYVLIQTLLYSVITYFLIHFEFNAAKFFWYVLFTYLTLLFFTYYGFCAVAISPQVMLAAIMSSMFFSVWFIMAGFFIPYKSMPKWAAWYYWLDPLSYLLYGIITSQLGEDQSLVLASPGRYLTVQQFLQDMLGFEASFVPWCVLIMVGYVIVFVSVIVLAFKKFNFNKR